MKNNELKRSHIGHFNEKGASKSKQAAKESREVPLWNWKEIQATSRKLKYQIHNRMAIKKIGSFGVLGGADKLEKSGIIFR